MNAAESSENYSKAEKSCSEAGSRREKKCLRDGTVLESKPTQWVNFGCLQPKLWNIKRQSCISTLLHTGQWIQLLSDFIEWFGLEETSDDDLVTLQQSQLHWAKSYSNIDTSIPTLKLTHPDLASLFTPIDTTLFIFRWLKDNFMMNYILLCKAFLCFNLLDDLDSSKSTLAKL